MSEIDLLPRADLPVIWDAFKAQAEPVRQIAETLTVTDISQKEEMALARKTRLTLREIRIAVEHKRVELGEGHLKEIQKVNGAAKAIREFIEPMEARLLIQESFAERAEEKRIAELTRCRNAELFAIRPHVIVKDVGAMSQENYDGLIAALRAEQAEKEAANRLRIEAERRLAEQAIVMRRQEEEFLAKLQAEKVAENARLAAQRAEAQAEQDRQHAAARVELDRANAIAEAKALEVYAELKRQNEAEQAVRVIEAIRLETERAVREIEIAEQKRIRDEQFAVLEAELAQANAAKLAEAEAARKLALAPDVEKLQAYVHALLSVPIPSLDDPLAKSILQNVIDHVSEVPLLTEFFVQKNLILK